MPNAEMYISSMGQRRQGRTTAVIDLAIMNARGGATVEVWCMNRPSVDRLFRLAMDRMQITNTMDGATWYNSHSPVIRFNVTGGRITFMSSEAAGRKADPGHLSFQTDMKLDDESGRILRRADVPH